MSEARELHEGGEVTMVGAEGLDQADRQRCTTGTNQAMRVSPDIAFADGRQVGPLHSSRLEGELRVVSAHARMHGE